MKKTILTSLVAVFAASAASAANVTPYAAVRGGYDYTILNGGEFSANGETDGTLGQNPNGSGYNLGAAAGVSVDLNKFFGVRGEVEYSYNNTKVTAQEMDYDEDLDAMVAYDQDYKTDSHTVMLNGYADFKTGTAFTPYVGAGLGYSWATLKVEDAEGSIKFDDSAFTWQVGAGVSYAVDRNLSVELDYRFMDIMGLGLAATEVEDDEAVNLKLKSDLYSHQVRLGVRYAF